MDTPRSQAEVGGISEGNLRSITVQLLPSGSMLQGQAGTLLQGTSTILQSSNGQVVTSLQAPAYQTGDPIVTQTLLDIEQAEESQDKFLTPDASSNQMNVEGEDEESNLEDERTRVAEDIRQQMRELCNQLADVGEESFLVSVRVHDGAFEHLGSIKGDHFCLLRQEMLKDFHDFCLGIASETRNEGDDDEEEEEEVSKPDLSPNDSNTMPEEDEDEEYEESKMEVDDADVEKPYQNVPVPRVVTPKVVVMQKTDSEKKVSGDHPYTSAGAKTKVSSVRRDEKTEGKENKQTTTTSILFLCDLCKDVFDDIRQLREHKLQIHQEGDYKCDQCPRVFSLKRTHERHIQDAHNPESEDQKFLCDTCVMDFTSKTSLDEHIKNHHNHELPMKCDVCEQTFKDISSLMDHRAIHFDYDCFCNVCWQGFFDYLELETHVQSNCRYKEALYKCDVCGKKYTKLAAINKHIDTHPIHSPHVCRMCGRGFESEKDLKYHRTAAHIIRPFKCEFCEKTFKKKESVIEHRRIHLRVKMYSNSDGKTPFMVRLGRSSQDDESTEYECHICGIILPTQGTLDQHLHQHETASEQHQCDRCDKVFFSHSLLTVHCRKEHKVFLSSKEDQSLISSDLLACEWEGCNKTFYDRTKWKYHMKYHEQRADKIAKGIPLTPKMSSTTCELCGKVLKYKSYLKAHMLTHSNEQPHQCDICGQAYSNHKRLQDHIRVHKGERPFKCRVCDKTFTSTSLRNQHMVVHWGHKTYICDVCGKGFMSRKHFHDHMRIHNGEQPHRCETCGKDFIYYRSLVRHALTHIDPKERPKPYKCQYCGKEYTEVTGYKHHLRSVHTGETPFQCDICGDAFHRNDKLKRHMKSRHNKALSGLLVNRHANMGGSAALGEKSEQEQADELLQIVQEGGAGMNAPNELQVDVIQDGGSQQVFLIGLGNEGGEATYLQETQVIEGPDGVRYIIAGSGEELQIIDSGNLQHLQEGEIVSGDMAGDDAGNVLIMNDGQTFTGFTGQSFTSDQETLTTLANMASVAEVADIVQQQ